MTRRRRTVKLQPIEQQLQERLGVADHKQLELPTTPAPLVSNTRVAAPPCTGCGRWNYHLKSCRLLAKIGLAITAALFFACGDNTKRLHFIEGPDAGVDAPADACVNDVDAGADDCCRFLPDFDAVRACALPQLPAGSCAELVCFQHDCSHVEVTLCAAALDAGVQPPTE